MKKGDRCPCADDLNFGEPQPDCHTCGGTGVVKRPNKKPDPVFNFKKKKKTK